MRTFFKLNIFRRMDQKKWSTWMTAWVLWTTIFYFILRNQNKIDRIQKKINWNPFTSRKRRSYPSWEALVQIFWTKFKGHYQAASKMLWGEQLKHCNLINILLGLHDIWITLVSTQKHSVFFQKMFMCFRTQMQIKYG